MSKRYLLGFVLSFAAAFAFTQPLPVQPVFITGQNPLAEARDDTTFAQVIQQGIATGQTAINTLRTVEMGVRAAQALSEGDWHSFVEASSFAAAAFNSYAVTMNSLQELNYLQVTDGATFADIQAQANEWADLSRSANNLVQQVNMSGQNIQRRMQAMEFLQMRAGGADLVESLQIQQQQLGLAMQALNDVQMVNTAALNFQETQVRLERQREAETAAAQEYLGRRIDDNEIPAWRETMSNDEWRRFMFGDEAY